MGNTAVSSMSAEGSAPNGSRHTNGSDHSHNRNQPPLTPKVGNSKRYRHYSADWVRTNEMMDMTQKPGADPLLVAAMAHSDDHDDVYNSDVDYDSDFEMDGDKDMAYVQGAVDIDAHGRTYDKEVYTGPSLADSMRRTRSRAKLADLASNGSSSFLRHSRSGSKLAGKGAGGITAIVGSGGNATLPLHGRETTVVLPLDTNDISIAESAWQRRHFEPQDGEIEILIAFMSGVADLLTIAKRRQDDAVNTQLGRLLLVAHQQLLQNKSYRNVDMHALAEREEVLSAYMYAKHKVMTLSAESNTTAQLAPVKESAMLYQSTTGQTRLAMTFGGQGYNWLSDFTTLYNTYPQLHSYVQTLLKVVDNEANSIEAQTLGFYTHGTDVLQWAATKDTTKRPPLQYIQSAPISYPLIGVTQLANYYITLRALDKTPQEFLQHFAAGGVTGHSQGIVSAVVAAVSSTEQEFIKNSQEAIKFLFWHGARTQQVCPLQSVSFKVLQESLTKGFGVPSPMLSVRGLPREQVQQHVNTINATLKQSQHIYISLINGPDAVVVSGQPLQLHQLRQLLSTIQADPSQNQNRTPYSQRKKTFTCRYLPSSVPFHSPHLQPAVELIAADCKRLNIMQWSGKSLRAPVWHTHNVVNLQQSSDLLHELITMQTVQSVDWQLLCNQVFVKPVHPEQLQALSTQMNGSAKSEHQHGVTHVVDFGPGGLGGTAKLTLDNVEGSGCKVVAMDTLRGNEQIAGKAVLYDSRDSHIPHAINWYESFAPKLVKRSSKLQAATKATEEQEESKTGEVTPATNKLDVNQLVLESKFTRAFNKPLILVPGMTPCTVGEGFVSAIAQAGYHVELAGGGQHTEQIMRNRVATLSKMLPAGMAFTINLLFLNAYLWKFQFPLVVQLRREGYPIDGITIGAGVPSPEMSDDILAQLREVGILNMGLKPGSLDAISACRDIAVRNPQSNIIIQWTGGRAGGHHSCEDQHQPMLDMYASLRQVPNIVLVVGGGIGDAASASYYLNGTWSLKYGRQAMPFDAVMCGSRVMIAAECPTAPDCKKLLASVPGVPDDQWETSFDNDSFDGAGGVITILSELGEPIHKVSNRGTRLWRKFDNTYFNLPREKIGAAVANDKKQIIEALNADFQKPYFCAKADGTVVEDLRDMTYIDVATRLLQMFYLAPLDANDQPHGQPEWIDITYTMRWNDWLIRTVERFTSTISKAKQPEWNIYSLLASGQNPHDIVKQISLTYPLATSSPLMPEDALYFLSLCKRPGKPVNFVPIIDQDLKFWLKKDSLWFAEDLRSVPGHDAQKVAILQGPVATMYAKEVDEPVKHILDGIHNGLKNEQLQQLTASGDIEQLENSASNLLNATPLRALVERYHVDMNNVQTRHNAEQLIDMYKSLQSLPETVVAAFNIPENDQSSESINTEHWLQMLSGLDANWRRAVMLSPLILRDTLWLPNQLSAMFLPKRGQTVVLSATSGQKHAIQIDRVRVYDHTLVKMGLAPTVPAVELLYDSRTRNIQFILRHPKSTIDTMHAAKAPVSELKLQYTFVTSTCVSVHGALQEQHWAERCNAVLSFYRSLWLEDSSNASEESTQVLCSDDIRRFRAAIGDNQANVTSTSDNDHGKKVEAPLDYGIVLAWESICQALMSGLDAKYGSADLLSLVHLSNEFIQPTQRQSGPSHTLRSGDRVAVTSELLGVWDEVEGRVITVRAHIRRTSGDHTHDKEQAQSAQIVQTIVSRFAIPPRAVRSTPEQQKALFRHVEHKYTLQLEKEVQQMLMSKKWHDLSADKLQHVPAIVFEITSIERHAKAGSKGKEQRLDIETTGVITMTNGQKVGTVNSTGENVLKDVVVGFMQRHAAGAAGPIPLAQTQYYPVQQQSATSSNVLYAITSKDVNPIHTNQYAVSLAGLPATIVHGMHTSARCRQIVTALAQGGSNVAYKPIITKYKAEFKGMILPSMRTTALTTINAMQNGERVLTLELRATATGSLLMKATAHVQQPPTAYMFTGQGSAVVGMGMQLYDKVAEDSAVRKVWDAADAYFVGKYGFSILEIVRENPKTLHISLTGSQGGKWRSNYAALTVNKPNAEGQYETQPLFPEARDSLCEAITFKSVDGLLFQTQFQQPAILLTEKAFFEHMAASGVVAKNSIFAGHSLGEYGAIGALLNGLDTAKLAEVVFLRGLTMQSAVPRDELNRSRYGMVAVSPIRVNPWFNERALEALIALIMDASTEKDANKAQKQLLQIVNYNTLGTQYVAAGSLLMLEALRIAIDNLADLSRKMMKQMLEKQHGKAAAESTLKTAAKSGWPSDMPPLPLSEDEVKELFADIAQKAMAAAREAVDATKDGFLPLKRGSATVPLVGIDVPFHSSLLVDGVPTFRKILDNIFHDIHLSPADLEHRYIPNLLGAPFEMTTDFISEVYQRSKSPVVQEILSEWKSHQGQTTAEKREDIAKKLVVELLAYQFASPVQWITTQAQLVEHGYRRFVEIGPSPVLTTMLKRGIAESLAKEGDLTEILYSGRDEDRILGADEASPDQPNVQWDNEKEEQGDEAERLPAQNKPQKKQEAPKPQPKAEAPKAAPAPAPVSAPAPQQSSGGGGGGGSNTSVPLSVLHSTRVIIGMKLKVPFASLDTTKSVRGLAGGKSAIQNEILGDLSAEFKTEPEGADELPLNELASKLGSSPYTRPGKIISAQLSSMGSRVFPGGFGMAKAKDYLKTSYGLDEATTFGVQIHMLTMMPAARLGSEGEATEWIDQVVSSYASTMGASLKKASVGGGGGGGDNGGGAAVAAIDPKEMKRLKKVLAQQAAVLQAYADADTKAKEDSNDEEVLAKERLYLETIDAEHGSKYIEGIRPAFDAMKQRDYDSGWAWARVQTVQLTTKLQRIIDANDSAAFEKLQPTLHQQLSILVNRATITTKNYVATFNIKNAKQQSSIASSVLEFTKQLEQHLTEALSTKNNQSRYREYSDVTLPVVEVTAKGETRMRDELRYKVDSKTPGASYVQFVDEMVATKENSNRYKLDLALPMSKELATKLQSVVDNDFVAAFKELAQDGLSFEGKSALITGAGEGSIGAEVARCMLQGGAHVIVTTSRPTKERWDYYRALYKMHGGRGAKLTVLPYNAASMQDTDKLVEYLFDSKGINLPRLDFCLPFAAIPEQGRDVTRIDAISELAHRAMLINVHRLIGGIVSALHARRVTSAQTLIALPLSPNHGIFGGDGLYAESKIGLETLFNRWRSEGWSDTVSLVGVEIGWTRGTGLMNANDLIAQDMEKDTGMRTFSQIEMAFSIVGLFAPKIVTLAARCPLRANFTGGFHLLASGSIPIADIRAKIVEKQQQKKLVWGDFEADVQHTGQPKYHLLSPDASKQAAKALQPRAHLQLSFPELPTSKPNTVPQLPGLLDLSTVVVCVGYGEVGPWGSSRTRWEYELSGVFSMEGAIELARSMHLIKFHSGPLTGVQGEYVGWIDEKEKKPVADHEIASKYIAYIHQHAGIRPIEPELFDGYNPLQKQFLQQIAVEADMPPFEVTSAAEVDHLRARHGKNLEIIEEGERTLAKLKAGAVIYVPKNRPFSRTVAGQIPTGWDPQTYGVPEDIAKGVDQVTCYALAATIDAFASAGIRDPFELYQHAHVSEVGNSVGGGMGGMTSLKAIFRQRFMDAPGLSSDLLQETFINTTPAWINMLLLSASGPIKTPVAACATAAVSVELAADAIKTGKAKFMIAGGTEDFGEEGSYEFAQMNATSNADNEFAKGRPASEHSRPSTSTRAGFMESQGAGIQLLASAEMAIAMGLPIYAIIAGTATATDRQGRSIPAPGRGILTTARESKHTAEYDVVQKRLCDIDYRRQQLQREVQYLEQQRDEQLQSAQGNEAERDFIEREHQRRLKIAQQTWGNSYALGHPAIAPLRASIGTFGLTMDDIEVCSFHGTSTKANDKNESAVVHLQQQHLGRSAGQPLYTIWQKWLTGHPKGSAAAWMLNGLIQSMHAGIIPANRNADNIGSELEANSTLIYTDEPIDLGRPLKAGYLHSFGFGQAGGQTVIVHPNYLFNALVSDGEYQTYAAKRTVRERQANRHWLEYMCGEHGLVPIITRAPYTDDEVEATYLDPLARAKYVPAENAYHVKPTTDRSNVSLNNTPYVTAQDLSGNIKSSTTQSLQQSLQKSASAAVAPAQQHQSSTFKLGTGVDVEELSDFKSKDETFLKRNFTDSELQYIKSEASDSTASLAGRWCAKEATIKALSSYASAIGRGGDVQWKSAGSPLNEIEIITTASGSPAVQLTGHAAAYAAKLNVDAQAISLTISHTNNHAIAHATVIGQ